ncbi:PDZ domain-containing protein, partial [Salmonella enterica subsp. enterica serovar Kentucky]|nr:PDZ domain-containing protein [Salmonella enterica subsp. enterica serovar Kentucky]
LDEQGNADAKKSLTSHLASGTPGTVAGFSLALEKYGTMPLNKGQDKGVVVSSVKANSPAAQIGLKKGDVIIGANQQPVKNIA